MDKNILNKFIFVNYNKFIKINLKCVDLYFYTPNGTT